ncbi:MAG: GNAT family N-acetyltransferase [Thermoplasmata archaeon]|nr:GNAT family N-acetyltransferase [Thermoplasmata archaeon]
MGRSGTLVLAQDAPGETLRLLDEQENDLDRQDPMTGWIRSGLNRLKERVRSGQIDGVLWIGPKDEAVGLATWPMPAGAGRRVSAYLASGYRTPAALAAFLRALDGQGPVRSVYGPVLGVPDEAVGAALSPAGFLAVVRGDMTYPETSPTPAVSPIGGHASRSLDAADQGRIAGLLERAYSDTPIDRWLFAQSTDASRDAEQSAADLLGTGVGRWVPGASFGVEVKGRLVAATLVHELDGPLLSEVMVDPAWRRRGFARHLVARSIHAVRRLGLGTLRLVVTWGNDRAQPLYRSVGFVDSPIRGTIWLRLPP